MKVRFSRKGDAVFAVILGEPKGKTVTIKDVKVKDSAKLGILGGGELNWKHKGRDLELELPESLPAKYALAVKIDGAQ